MLLIKVPDFTQRDVSFYLAMEEFVARNLKEEDAFMMWQVPPSVVFGRNQLIDNEVNVQFCRQHGIKFYRRKSGGGCVYADLNNIMCAYITKSDNVAFAYNKYINMMMLALRKMGVQPHANTRNDILIGDRKVAGNAFYRINHASIIHGTLLYDTDMTNMMQAITPTKEKLTTKGIESVRQRIALLKDFVTMGIEEVKTVIATTLCHEETTLTNQDIKTIETIEKEYLSESFLYGNNPKYTIVRKKVIPEVGEVEARIRMKNNTILSMQLTGDFFVVGDIQQLILSLKGVEWQMDKIEKAIPDNLQNIILNLQKQQFLNLLIP